MIPLPGATKFSQVTRQAVLEAGGILGLNRRIGERELNTMATALPKALAAVRAGIEAENQHYPAPARVFLAGEQRLLLAVERLLVPFMLERVNA